MEQLNEVKRKVAEARKSKAAQTELKSPRIKKIAKKQKLDVNELVANKHGRSSVNTCCEPQKIHDMVANLNTNQRQRLNELGFGWVFKFKVGGHVSRDLIEYFMDHLNPDSMVINLGGQGELPVTHHAVHYVLELQDGHLDPPIGSDVADLRPVRQELGISGTDRIYYRHLMDRIQREGD